MQAQQPPQTQYPKVGIGVIVRKNNQVLIGKRAGSLGKGSWAFPGGHLEFYESWTDCARRETEEETNIKIKNIRFGIATNDIFENLQKHYITIFMTADYSSGKLQVLEPKKCERWGWFKWENLPQPLFLPLKNLLKTGFNPFKNS